MSPKNTLSVAECHGKAVGRVSRERGQRVLTTERPLRQGAGIADLDDIDVMTFLAEAIGPFVER